MRNSDGRFRRLRHAIIFGLMAVFLLVGAAACGSTSKVTVNALHWETRTEVEDYEAVTHEGWATPPHTARDIKKVSKPKDEATSCPTTKAVAGKKKPTTKPCTKRDSGTYATWYIYKTYAWKTDDEDWVITTGDKTEKITWAKPTDLESDEREGDQRPVFYFVDYTDKQGETHSKEINRKVWSKLAVGQKVKVDW